MEIPHISHKLSQLIDILHISIYKYAIWRFHIKVFTMCRTKYLYRITIFNYYSEIYENFMLLMPENYITYITEITLQYTVRYPFDSANGQN